MSAHRNARGQHTQEQTLTGPTGPDRDDSLSLDGDVLASGLFESLDSDIHHQLLTMVRPRRYKRGELLYAEGDAGSDLLLLMSGTVVLFRSTSVERRAALAAVRAPGVLGDEALADGVSRATSAEALRDSFALALPGLELRDLMQEHPAMDVAARRWLAHRLATLAEQRADDILLDLPTRVAKTLVTLVANGDPQATVDLSQQWLAGVARGSRQSVNQILKDFARRGWLYLDTGQILVTNLEAMRQRAGLRGQQLPYVRR